MHASITHRPLHARLALLAAAGCVALGAIAGCSLVGALARNLERTGSHKVEAAYDGLQGKSFAVVVSAGRAIEGEHPGVVEEMIRRLTDRLAKESGATGVVPADQVIRTIYKNPTWSTRPLGEIGAMFGGPDRLVFVDLSEYRLNDPGNSWEWAGAASATVSVSEHESVSPDTPAFQRLVRVSFPTKKGIGPDQATRQVVTSELLRRFVERSAWLFFKHDELNEVDY